MEKNIIPALVASKLKALNLYSTQGELANLIAAFDGEPMYQSWVSMALNGKNKKTLGRIDLPDAGTWCRIDGFFAAGGIANGDSLAERGGTEVGGKG